MIFNSLTNSVTRIWEHNLCGYYVSFIIARYKQAEADLLEAVRLQPNFPDAVLNLQQVQKDIATGRTFNKEIVTRT